MTSLDDEVERVAKDLFDRENPGALWDGKINFVRREPGASTPETPHIAFEEEKENYRKQARKVVEDRMRRA